MTASRTLLTLYCLLLGLLPFCLHSSYGVWSKDMLPGLVLGMVRGEHLDTVTIGTVILVSSLIFCIAYFGPLGIQAMFPDIRYFWIFNGLILGTMLMANFLGGFVLAMLEK